jgi:6-phosphogluconolactonase
MNRELIRCSDSESLASQSADYICNVASTAIANSGRFTIALSGGSSPERLYQLLATDGYRDRIDWSAVHIFWSDERCVPPTDAHSNYRMASDNLLAKIDLPEENIHRIPAEIHPPEQAAKIYEESLREFFSKIPHLFDLCLLGLGADGHTASIFPGASLNESALVVATTAPDQMSARDRITLTTSAINRSRAAAFIVSGRDKHGILAEILSNRQANIQRYPAAGISPDQELIWFIDEEMS